MKIKSLDKNIKKALFYNLVVVIPFLSAAVQALYVESAFGFMSSALLLISAPVWMFYLMFTPLITGLFTASLIYSMRAVKSIKPYGLYSLVPIVFSALNIFLIIYSIVMISEEGLCMTCLEQR